MKFVFPRFLFSFSLSIFFIIHSYTQTGGTGTYKFLELPNSARIASLGGKNVSLADGDLNMAYHNPATLAPEMDRNIVLNGVSYFANTGFGYASFAKEFDSIGTFAIGIQYIDYGTFNGYDKYNVSTGVFFAKDYALSFIYSKSITKSLRLGISVKPIYSSYERYSSYGLASDIGAVYISDDNLTSAGVTLKNIGFQITSYTGNYREPLPFEFLLGVSKKLEHAPFRFSITAHSLQQYDLLYTTEDDTEEDPFYPSTQKPSKTEKFADNFFRHIIAGLEFLPSKSLYVSVAYNYQRRKELGLKDSPGSVGFSFGGGIRLKKFGVSYGRSKYHVAGASNHFSITINLGESIHK